MAATTVSTGNRSQLMAAVAATAGAKATTTAKRGWTTRRAKIRTVTIHTARSTATLTSKYML